MYSPKAAMLAYDQAAFSMCGVIVVLNFLAERMWESLAARAADPLYPRTELKSHHRSSTPSICFGTSTPCHNSRRQQKSQAAATAGAAAML
jgi:hypothetical protein